MTCQCQKCGAVFTTKSAETSTRCAMCGGESSTTIEEQKPRKQPKAARSVCLGCGRRSTSSKITRCHCGSDRIARRKVT